METNLLDKMLSTYQSQKTPVTIVLQNKARISGRIGSFDSYVIIMDKPKSEIVYRHAIASLLPFTAAERPREQKTEQVKPVPRPASQPAKYPPQASAKRKPQRPAAPKAAAASSEPGLNNGMKEGLLRWMQERKAGK